MQMFEVLQRAAHRLEVLKKKSSLLFAGSCGDTNANLKCVFGIYDQTRKPSKEFIDKHRSHLRCKKGMIRCDNCLCDIPLR